MPPFPPHPWPGALTPSDIWPVETFCQYRTGLVPYISALRAKRRILLGPNASVVFETKALIWWQIQEMLRIEKGGPEQLQEELACYAPLIPTKGRLVVTLMLEYPDATERKHQLHILQDIAHTLFLTIGTFTLQAGAIDPVEEPSPKASAVNFLAFTLPPETLEAFKTLGAAVLSLRHPAYTYHQVLSPALCADLLQDIA